MAIRRQQTPEAAHRVARYDVQGHRALRENYVTLHNALVRAAHGLSLVEKRVVMAAVSKLDSRRRPNDILVRTRITAAEYAETFGGDVGHAYRQLDAAAKQLHKRTIMFYEPPTRRQSKPTKVCLSWVTKTRYQEGEGWVELSWNNEVLPLLTGLREQFTTFQLQQASALRSAYSWKLLELLSQYKSSGHAELTVEEFAHAMEATEKQRKDFGKIREKIIEPAVRELVGKDGWLIEWEPVKRGRKVAALRFKFARNPQQSLF